MLLVDYLVWWYGLGWRNASLRTIARVRKTYQDFSVIILLRTLAKPWRRIITVGAKTPAERLRGLLDNLVSRFVGFTVRLAALIAAVALMFLELVIGLVIAVIWPLVPVGGVILIVWGLL